MSERHENDSAVVANNAASSIVDALSSVVMEGKMAKLLSWYDNEWGYRCRVDDLATFMAEREL